MSSYLWAVFIYQLALGGMTLYYCFLLAGLLRSPGLKFWRMFRGWGHMYWLLVLVLAAVLRTILRMIAYDEYFTPGISFDDLWVQVVLGYVFPVISITSLMMFVRGLYLELLRQ